MTLPQIAFLFNLTRAEVTQFQAWLERHSDLMTTDDGLVRLGPAMVALRAIAQAERLAQLAAAVRDCG